MADRTGWRKSSSSTDQGECVEVPAQLDALRDSKNTSGPVLAVGSSFSAFISAVKADRLTPVG